MASIFKREWYIDQDGRRCPAGTPGAERRQSKRWTIKIGGKQFRGYQDRDLTWQKAARLEQELERKEEAQLQPYAAHRARPLLEHVEAWLSELADQGQSRGYLACCRTRLTRLSRECRWATLPDISADSFLQWRATARSRTTHNAKAVGIGAPDAGIGMFPEGRNTPDLGREPHLYGLPLLNLGVCGCFAGGCGEGATCSASTSSRRWPRANRFWPLSH